MVAFAIGFACSLAQAADTFPAWLVPVLQVVTETDVIPGTGVVLGPGRVLVPAEFAAVEAPLVVLDGGGDLARHGRPATVLERWSLAGLVVLDVPGLVRPAPMLAAGPLDDGQAVALWAVAPAELLRQGEATLSRRATLAVDASGQVTLGQGQRLPNLTGVLVDACGQWVGHSAARGVASLATAANTLYQWLPQLRERLARGGFEFKGAVCDRSFAPPVVSSPVAAPAAPEEDTTPVVPDDTPVAGDDAGAPAPVADSPEPEPPITGSFLDEPELLPAPDLPPPEGPVPGSDERVPGALDAGHSGAEVDGEPTPGIPAWAWGLMLVGVVMAVLALQRSVRGRAVATGPVRETVAWLRGEEGTLAIEAADGVVDCILGRNDAELLVLGTTISRHHARFRGAPGSLQLVDLESTNGTFVNDRPCAPRTGVPVNAGDRLRFGDRDFELLAADEVTP